MSENKENPCRTCEANEYCTSRCYRSMEYLIQIKEIEYNNHVQFIDNLFKEQILKFLEEKNTYFAEEILKKVGSCCGYSDSDYTEWLEDKVQEYIEGYNGYAELGIGEYIMDCMIDEQ